MRRQTVALTCVALPLAVAFSVAHEAALKGCATDAPRPQHVHRRIQAPVEARHV